MEFTDMPMLVQEMKREILPSRVGRDEMCIMHTNANHNATLANDHDNAIVY